MKFLTARWHNLILANYAIPEELLRPHLPPGIEFDRRDGECWGSLVGFQFLKTRVLGLSWPGYRNFPEWNLRFYVKQGDTRGVVFVREFVPQRLTAAMARLIYNEPYRAAKLTMTIEETETSLTAAYTVAWGGKMHALTCRGTKPSVVPPEDSTEQFFKEHSWGYGTGHLGKLIRYEVHHPKWAVYPVEQFDADVDWGLLYGPQWAAMNAAKPASVVLAAGSEVSVFPHHRR